MSATTSSAPAREPSPNRLQRLGVETGLADGVQWCFRRNCSLTPGELLLSYLVLCAFSLGIAAFFWAQGVRLIAPFAGLEMLVLGAALLVYARHAGDRETIAMRSRRLLVEHHCGNRVEQAEFDAAWVRIEPSAGDGSLLELSGHGRRIRVGRFVRPELRAQLAIELRQALRRWHASGVGAAGMH